jgi:hypothetical protein
MHQRTGSVYLDAPPRPSRRPTKERGFSRVRVGATAVGIGLIALTVAASVTGLRSLILDPGLTTTAFDRALDDQAARAELQEEIAAAIEAGLIGEELVAVAAAFELDVTEEARRVAPMVLDDDTVRAELRALTEELHARVLIEADGTALDLRPITLAVHAVVDDHSPRLAAIIPSDAALWTVEAESLPDLTAIAEHSNRILRYSLLGALLIPLGFAVHPRRHRMAAWMGRWIAAFGLICAIAAVALPYLGGALAGFRSAEIAIRSISLRLLAPAAVSGIVGIGLVSLAALLKSRDKLRVTGEGAAAALGYDEPPLWQQRTEPELDLAARGLVDVNHPLTSI